MPGKAAPSPIGNLLVCALFSALTMLNTYCTGCVKSPCALSCLLAVFVAPGLHVIHAGLQNPPQYRWIVKGSISHCAHTSIISGVVSSYLVSRGSECVWTPPQVFT